MFEGSGNISRVPSRTVEGNVASTGLGNSSVLGYAMPSGTSRLASWDILDLLVADDGPLTCLVGDCGVLGVNI